MDNKGEDLHLSQLSAKSIDSRICQSIAVIEGGLRTSTSIWMRATLGLSKNIVAESKCKGVLNKEARKNRTEGLKKWIVRLRNLNKIGARYTWGKMHMGKSPTYQGRTQGEEKQVPPATKYFLPLLVSTK